MVALAVGLFFQTATVSLGCRDYLFSLSCHQASILCMLLSMSLFLLLLQWFVITNSWPGQHKSHIQPLNWPCEIYTVPGKYSWGHLLLGQKKQPQPRTSLLLLQKQMLLFELGKGKWGVNLKPPAIVSNESRVNSRVGCLGTGVLFLCFTLCTDHFASWFKWEDLG